MLTRPVSLTSHKHTQTLVTKSCVAILLVAIRPQLSLASVITSATTMHRVLILYAWSLTKQTKINILCDIILFKQNTHVMN